jgi:hypothetical protein
MKKKVHSKGISAICDQSKEKENDL